MNNEERLFNGFAVLEPSAEETAEAIRKTRATILAARSTVTATESAKSQRSSRPWARLALAASVLFIVGVVWMNLPNNNRLLAQVIRQMANAKSLRTVVESKEPGGDWATTQVTMFDRELGYRDQYFRGGELEQTDFDDGLHHWVVRPRSNIVTRCDGFDFKWLLNQLIDPLNSGFHFVRDSARDQLIDDVSHKCFKLDEQNQRVSIWMDADDRLRLAIVESNTNGSWSPTRRVNVKYDVEFERSALQPPSGDGVKIVEAKQLFDELFSLETAIHREQRLGYELAIHDVKRISDVEYYLLMSFRPTNETLAKLHIKRGESPGDLHPGMRIQRGATPGTQESETAHRLAVAYANGIRVQALLCTFSGIEFERVERARPQFTLFAHPKLWGPQKSISEVSMDFELPKEETPLEDIVRTVYEKIAILEPVTMDELYLRDDADGRRFVDRQHLPGAHSESHRENPRPSEISLEEFLEHVHNADFRPDLNARAVAIARRNREGSDDPLTFIREIGVPNDQRPERWQHKLRTFLGYSDLEVQLASLRFIEKEPMLYYAEQIVRRIEDSHDPRVQAAGQGVLELLKRPLKPIEPKESAPPVEIDIERIGSLIEQLQKQVDVKATVRELGDRTGLDYGDGMETESRSRWSRWWSDEQESISSAHLGDREFLVYGRVVDNDGNPLPNRSAGVWVSREFSNTGSLRSAHTSSDINGRYILRFGFRKLDPPGLPPVLPIVNAYLSVSSLAVPADGRSERLVLSRYDLADDLFLKDHANKSAVYPRQPFEIDFIDHPTAFLSIKVFDEDGEQIVPEKVSIAYSDIRTGDERESALTTGATEGNRYYWPQLVDSEATIRIQKSKTSKVRSSQPIIVKAPGSHDVGITMNEDSSGLLEVELSPKQP